MKYYQAFLKEQGFRVHYIETLSAESEITALIKHLAQEAVTEIHYTDPTDNWLEKRIRQQAVTCGVRLVKCESPNFLNRMQQAASFFTGRKTYFQTDFYIHQRKQRKILVEKDNTPAGGKWSFDTANRCRFPSGQPLPAVPVMAANEFTAEAVRYVRKQFPGNYGDGGAFHYPVTHADAMDWLDDFLANRFANFGTYEDAMLKKESILHHSVLTPMLNTGLLDPQTIIDKTLASAGKNAIPLNATEGFLRQIMGWREFIRIVYEREGTGQRTRNYWGFSRKIPDSFWKGETGIHPVDTVIKRVLKTGYSHHIERLMVLGNFMLLCEFDPDEVYRWFMEMYIDSYDWVMVPNVYSMTQFADGGLMTTKPYISGSNYLLKMGDWDKGAWQQVWDGLFWRFMHVHRDFFVTNPRLGMLVKTFDKMPAEKREAHLARANDFLKQLDA